MIWIRAITGFNFLGYHQAKNNSNISKVCRLCEQDNETFIHFITECLVLRETRNGIFLDNIPNDDMTWSINKIMEFINFTEIYNMLVSKEDLRPIEVIDVIHTYSSDADSTD